jgi:16S rRNA (guanine(966)-N(2))-methyltransferase RsmD
MPDRGRVIGGSARGLRLEAPRGGVVRPLSDRVKESLFGALEADGALAGPFLDLYAGSGAGGIEALSRGAPTATFVERDDRACAVIRANLARARLAGGTVIGDDVGRYLTRARDPDAAQFTAVLVDPPYGDETLGRTLAALASGGWLAHPGVVVAKHFWRDDPPERIGSLRRRRQKRFGETVLSFYTREEGSIAGEEET